MGILRSILTPAPDEVDAVRKALDAKATSEPVVREQRATLSKPVPTWAARIDATTEISHASLDELEAAITERLRLLESYPAGPKRDKAIERHQQAAAQIDAWRQELPADIGTENSPESRGADAEVGDSQGVNHHEHALSAI